MLFHQVVWYKTIWISTALKSHVLLKPQYFVTEEKSKSQSEAHENKDVTNFFPIWTHSSSERCLRGPGTQEKKLCNELGLSHDNDRGRKRLFPYSQRTRNVAQGQQGWHVSCGHWAGFHFQLPTITHWQCWFPGLWISESLSFASAAHSWASLPPHGLWRSGEEAHSEQKIPSWCCGDMQQCGWADAVNWMELPLLGAFCMCQTLC